MKLSLIHPKYITNSFHVASPQLLVTVKTVADDFSKHYWLATQYPFLFFVDRAQILFGILHFPKWLREVKPGVNLDWSYPIMAVPSPKI